MKVYYLGVLFFAAILLSTGCVKNTDPTGDSFGTLQSVSGGNCTPSTIHGLFRVDSTLTTDNYVDVLVDVAVAGKFTITSDSVNGYSFKKTGTLSSGTNTVRLYASGKPIAAGVNNFTISYGATFCTFSITVFATGNGYGTAFYTLGGAPNNCTLSNITGNYITGLAMTNATNNKVEMTVNVTNTGTYTMSTPTVNGVTFSTAAMASFVNPGVQNIFFTGIGTPISAGTFNYPVTNGSTNCSFSITYTTVIVNAAFSFSGFPNNCTGAMVNGTYTAGATLTAANTVLVNVNVTSPGNYAIATTTVNGISFSASGTFNLTGLRQVTLTGMGAPTVPGAFNYPLTGGGSNCSFSVTSL